MELFEKLENDSVERFLRIVRKKLQHEHAVSVATKQNKLIEQKMVSVSFLTTAREHGSKQTKLNWKDKTLPVQKSKNWNWHCESLTMPPYKRPPNLKRNFVNYTSSRHFYQKVTEVNMALNVPQVTGIRNSKNKWNIVSITVITIINTNNNSMQ